MPILKPYSVVASFPGVGREEWLLDSFVNLGEALNQGKAIRRDFGELVSNSDNVFIEIRKKGGEMDYNNTVDGLVGDLLLTTLATNSRFNAVIICPTRAKVDRIDKRLSEKNNELPVSLFRVAPRVLGIGSRSIRFLLPGALLAGYEFDVAILIDCDTVDPKWLEDLGGRIRAGGQIQAYKSKHDVLERNLELESLALRVQPAKPRHTPNVGNEDVYTRLETLEKSLDDLTGMVRIVSGIVLKRTTYIREILDWLKKLHKRD